MEILDHNIVYDYNYQLITGSLKEIREYVYKNSEAPAPPDYVFKNDRQHWIYENINDNGWPVDGELNLKLENKNSAMIGPKSFWQAEDAPKLYIKAYFDTEANEAAIEFETYKCNNDVEESKFSMRSVYFNIRKDIDYQVYEVDLSKNPEYKGSISRIKLNLPEKEGNARIKAIGFNSDVIK